MRNRILVVRKLVSSNLGWFLATRETLGEDAGRERAVNINAPVMDQWFPELEDDATTVSLTTHYAISDDGKDWTLTKDTRTIRLQGGDKNWRLAGEAIEGEFYGSLRVDDYLIMVFDRTTDSLSWTVVRNPRGQPSRATVVPEDEQRAYEAITEILDEAETASANMWLPSPRQAVQIIREAEKANPYAPLLLREQRIVLDELETDLADVGMLFPPALVRRYYCLLQSKPFVILTGLTGSGKTMLARGVASWFSDDVSQHETVAVGADWTANEQVVGYLDALDPTRYVRTPALEIVLAASRPESERDPHFLLLDEMNLSHVERYFSDFLSAMESGAPIHLHDSASNPSGVPDTIDALPDNLFTTGTVNVDETTYMFSPKVLDRAGVIEFQVGRSALEAFLADPKDVNSLAMERGGSPFANAFLRAARRGPFDLEPNHRSVVVEEITLFFEALSRHGLEFGLRTAGEMLEYIQRDCELSDGLWSPFSAIDFALLQKVLPKLHGSRKRLGTLLVELAYLTYNQRGNGIPSEMLLQSAVQAGEDRMSDFPFGRDEGGRPAFRPEEAFYGHSFSKLKRMLSLLEKNGFTSFAEA